MSTAASRTPPTANRYVAAFRAVSNSGMTDCHLKMLRLHYQAPERTVTAKQLAKLMDYASYSIVNAQYGRLARLVGEQLKYKPNQVFLGTLVEFHKRRKEWHWLMRREVAEALERLGWVEEATVPLPEEIPDVAAPLVEGAVCRISVNAYERNAEARRRCIKAHGTHCCVCGFSFKAVYGKIAEDYIHVHHLRPLSELDGEYLVDPVADLRPVCPNCHAVIHRGSPAFSIEEVQAFLRPR